MSSPSAADLVLEARTLARLSQRQLADRAGTSGPTIAAYESGSKEPRLSTVRRIIRATGNEVHLSIGAPLRRNEARALALHAVIVTHLQRSPRGVIELARHNLETMRAASGGTVAAELLDEWERLLNGPQRDLERLLTSRSERAHDLRQVSPFAGVLDANERSAAYAVARLLT